MKGLYLLFISLKWPKKVHFATQENLSQVIKIGSKRNKGGARAQIAVF